MTINEFAELVIAYGANGCSETESYTERQQGIVAQAWMAFSRADENFGTAFVDEYPNEAYEAAESFYDDFINEK